MIGFSGICFQIFCKRHEVKSRKHVLYTWCYGKKSYFPPSTVYHPILLINHVRSAIYAEICVNIRVIYLRWTASDWKTLRTTTSEILLISTSTTWFKRRDGKLRKPPKPIVPLILYNNNNSFSISGSKIRDDL